MLKEYIAKKNCFWGPQPGTETLVIKGTSVMAHGSEPNLDEFFEPLEAPEPQKEEPAQPKLKRGKKAQADEFNDL